MYAILASFVPWKPHSQSLSYLHASNRHYFDVLYTNAVAARLQKEQTDEFVLRLSKLARLFSLILSLFFSLLSLSFSPILSSSPSLPPSLPLCVSHRYTRTCGFWLSGSCSAYMQTYILALSHLKVRTPPYDEVDLPFFRLMMYISKTEGWQRLYRGLPSVSLSPRTRVCAWKSLHVCYSACDVNESFVINLYIWEAFSCVCVCVCVCACVCACVRVHKKDIIQTCMSGSMHAWFCQIFHMHRVLRARSWEVAWDSQ